MPQDWNRCRHTQQYSSAARAKASFLLIVFLINQESQKGVAQMWRLHHAVHRFTLIGPLLVAAPDLAIWKMIGKPFPQVDQTDRPGLAISWPNTQFPSYDSLFLDRTGE